MVTSAVTFELCILDFVRGMSVCVMCVHIHQCVYAHRGQMSVSGAIP